MTTNRNWTLPTVGEDGGAWGDILNNDTFEEIDTDVQSIFDKIGTADGIASLNSNGEVTAGQIPDLSITNTKTFSEESNLTTWVEAEEGDVGIVNDSDGHGTAYILTTNDPTDLANWAELKTPESPVQDVFGRTGSVTAESGDYDVSQVTNAEAPEDIDSTNWGDYEIQVNGTDGSGIINFKTN